jgi:hypothetical protein
MTDARPVVTNFVVTYLLKIGGMLYLTNPSRTGKIGADLENTPCPARIRRLEPTPTLTP